MNIKQQIELIKNKNEPYTRIRYRYSKRNNSLAWLKIAHSLALNGVSIHSFTATKKQAKLWLELIKYCFADKTCIFDLNKAIGLVGGTGTGKTLTMRTMSEFLDLNKIKKMKGNKPIPMHFRVFSSKEIAMDAQKNGSDALAKYFTYANICIDDLGAESQTVKHFGSAINVIEEIIETRDFKGLTTHFSSNLTKNEILNMYDSRVHSRLVGNTNIRMLVGDDIRLL